MSNDVENLPQDPALLRAMIAALQAENQKMSASLRAHDLLVQALRVRIAKLQKQKFAPSSEKIEREIEQLELALEDLQVALAETDDTPPDEGKAHKPYEFGVKATVATTLKRLKGGQFAINAKALLGRPYDGHTLEKVIPEIEALTGATLTRILADAG